MGGKTPVVRHKLLVLVSQGNYGILKYQDVSTGKPIAQCFTKLGRCDCMTQNSHNAIIHLGHHKGKTIWKLSLFYTN